MSKTDSTDLTQARLREVLHFDPETGFFTRKVRMSNRTKAGQRAGGVRTKGSSNIRVDWVSYPSARLAWFYHYGEWPKGRLVYRNGVEGDDRISNIALRSNFIEELRSQRITAENCRNALAYDPETGVFTWRVKKSKAKIGDVAGTLSVNGYIVIAINGRAYPAHQLAWLLTYGEWAGGELDHKNRIRDDNRISNLRKATRSENSQNTATPRHNTSGVKGVYLCRRTGRWMAYINLNKRMRFLGRYADFSQAVEARRAAEKRLHPFAAT